MDCERSEHSGDVPVAARVNDYLTCAKKSDDDLCEHLSEISTWPHSVIVGIRAGGRFRPRDELLKHSPPPI